MIVSAILTIVVLFAACSHRATNNQADDLQDSVTVSKDNSDESSDGHVCISENGRTTIESGTHHDGGTAPDY